LPESRTHIDLVKAIVNWIDTETNFPEHMAILVAAPDSQVSNQPPEISGRIPDVFGKSTALRMAIIGEAKTASDIETIRTRMQFSNYFQYLSAFHESTLVVAVPWYCVNQTKSLLRVIQKRVRADHVCVTVLEKLPG